MAFGIQDLLFQWESVGIFDYMLPFLLIFAVVFGVLSTTRILGGHRGVNMIISLVIGLMALRFGMVSAFFSEIFPRFGIGLSILIVIVIMGALFIPDQHKKGWGMGFAITGVVIAVAIVLSTFDQFAWFNSYFWNDYWGLIIGGLIMVILIIAVFVTSGEPPKDSGPAKFGPWWHVVDGK